MVFKPNLNNYADLSNIQYEKEPFEHCVIENFITPTLADKAYENILNLDPDKANSKFINKSSKHEYNKFGFSNINKLPVYLQFIFRELTSKDFIQSLEDLTGIKDLIYDDYSLLGAGIHLIKSGGMLDMHTDFNTYQSSKYGKVDRRINLLIYMNKDWEEYYTGDLLLRGQDQSIKRIKPLFNRAVIFNTTNKSIHGHPEILNTPEHIMRKSIALYYYTHNNTGDVDFEGDKTHTTLWY